MKKTIKPLPIWLIAGAIIVLTCFVLLLISETELPTKLLSSGITAIISAVIGVLLTVVVTQILLNRQSENEVEREKSVKVFEEKLKIYQHFLDKLQEIIKDNKITEDEVKELIFQISTVAMHTKSEYVNPILEELVGLVNTLENKNANSDEQNEKPFYSALADHIRKIVLEFQRELYPQKDGASIDVEKFNELVKTIDDSSEKEDLLKNIEDVTVKSVMEQFDKTLEEALRKRLPGEDWVFLANSAKEGTPRFYFHRADWSEGDYVGISYEGSTKAFFRAHSQDNPISRDLYLEMRRNWGGRLNGYNWYMQFKEDFHDLSQLVDACKKSDSDLIDYIVEILVRAAEYMDAYQSLYKMYKKIAGNTGADKVWIWKTHCVVNDFVFEGEENKVAIDTELDNGEWTVVLFGRDDKGEARTAEIVAKNPGLFASKDGGDGRYLYKKGVSITTIAKAAEQTVELAKIVAGYK